MSQDPNALFSQPQQSIVPDNFQQHFHSPEQELAYLRSLVSQHEMQKMQHPEYHHLSQSEIQHQQVVATQELVAAYHHTPGIHVEPAALEVVKQHVEIELPLDPEEHDMQVEELYHMMIAKGVKATLSHIDKQNDPHLLDDFHRFLVQYLAQAKELPQVAQKNELYKDLDYVLFEIALPKPAENERRTFKEYITIMEQLLSGLQSLYYSHDKGNERTYSMELALPAGSDEIFIFVGIPSKGIELFEKQVIGLFPSARVKEAPNDYNVFAKDAVSVGSYAKSGFKEFLSLKTFDEFEADPLDIIINVLTKLETHSEGAAIQYIVGAPRQDYFKEYGEYLTKLRNGEKVEDVGKAKKGLGAELWSGIKDIAKSQEDKDKEKEKKDKEKSERGSDEKRMDSLTKKIGTPLCEVSIRIIAAAPSEVRANSILSDLESAFKQFGHPFGNSVEFVRLKGHDLQVFFTSFSFRILDTARTFVLSFKELATLMHFPALSDSAPQLKQAKAATAPAPLEMVKDGIVLGYNNHRGKKTEVRMSQEDRIRHFYVIGQTGVGKSGTLLSMIYQDIQNGDGVCFIDPHGSDVNTILSWIPEHRMNDVIYFNPADTARPMGLNMLEYDFDKPEQKSLVIDELMGIFNQLFDKSNGGAMFEQYFKNSAMLVMGHPESGCTMLEITRVLAEKSFRELKLSHCTNPIVRQFWENATKTKGEQSLENFVPYISSKFDPLLSNEFMRPVVLQEKSAFDVRDIMDNKKILLVNLSKGLLGDLNTNLIGLILVGKIQRAAMSRASDPGKKFPVFYLYIDEFQNFVTPSISSILSEARKYGLSLNVAHQYISQLDEKIKGAILGNVGSMQIFRISPEDANQLEPRFKPTFTAEDIIKLDNREAYMSLLINGQPSSPFNMRTLDWPKQNKDIVSHIKEMCGLRYGRDRAEVEDEIFAKFAPKEEPKKDLDDLDFLNF
jgi:TraM recognition site of TraD and TraG